MLYIGIDPGEHTGMAVWDSVKREFVEVATLPLHRAMMRVQWYDTFGEGPVHVIFEDARQRKWFAPERNVSEYRGKLIGAGSVKRDSKIWEEFLSDNDIHRLTYQARGPQKGLTKWNADTFARVTGYKGRTSEHARDAALLVYGRR